MSENGSVISIENEAEHSTGFESIASESDTSTAVPKQQQNTQSIDDQVDSEDDRFEALINNMHNKRASPSKTAIVESDSEGNHKMEATWTFPSLAHLTEHCHARQPPSTYTPARHHSAVTKTIHIARSPPLSLPKQVAYHAALLAGRLLLTSPSDDPIGGREEVLVAVAIFMACKSEECSRRCADIVGAVSGVLAGVTVQEVIAVEPTALARTGFDFTVDTPYRHVIRNMANLPKDAAEDTSDVVLEEAVKRVEWALARPIVFLHNQRVIGAASVWWAANQAGIKISNDADWRCDRAQVEECVRLLSVCE